MIRIWRVLGVGVLVCIGGLILSVTQRATAETSLSFIEPERGATFSYIDRSFRSHSSSGIPRSVSPGDGIVFTNRLEREGQAVGKIRATCTATQNGRMFRPETGGFLCTAIARIPGGSLILVAPLTEDRGDTEGAVTGGTGAYAGAVGTFRIDQARGYSTNSIFLNP